MLYPQAVPMSTSVESHSSADQASRYLSEFYREEAQRRDRNVPPPPRRSRAPLLALVTVPAFVVLTVFNIWSVRETGPAFTAAQDEGAGRFAIFVVQRQLEAFRTMHGRLPATLSEVDPQERTVRYHTNGSSYVLTVDAGRTVLTFREGDDLTPYQTAAARVHPGLAP